jgi:flavorubredoxin
VSILKKAIAEGLEERGVEQEARDLEKKEKAKQIAEEKE